jgi:two-component system copper resistance phosphate regulon response regulator CusR
MRLLFAEDDRQLLTSISRGLREATHEVDQANSGPQALSMAMATEYDGIILDVLLPGKSGIEVCRAIRAHGSRVPILMLTALDAVEHRIAGLDAGADDYLAKPFDFGELLARLRALDRRHGDTLTSRLVVGDLVLDAQRRVAQRNGREISFTAREFAFLLHLARNAGRVVSRAELMEHVWDDHPNVYSNIGLAFLPDLGGAAAFDHQADFLVEVTLDIERAGAGHLDHVLAPQPFGAEQLDIAAAAAEPLPRLHRQVLHPPHSDAAIDRHAFRLHEGVVGHGLALEFAEAGVLARLGLVPVGTGDVVHGALYRCAARSIQQLHALSTRVPGEAQHKVMRCRPGTPVSFK